MPPTRGLDLGNRIQGVRQRQSAAHMDCDDEGEGALDGVGAAEYLEPAFIPVVVLDEVSLPVEAMTRAAPVVARRETAAAALQSSVPARLRAQLTNGVTLELECCGRDGALVVGTGQAL